MPCACVCHIPSMPSLRDIASLRKSAQTSDAIRHRTGAARRPETEFALNVSYLRKDKLLEDLRLRLARYGSQMGPELQSDPDRRLQQYEALLLAAEAISRPGDLSKLLREL